MDGPSAFGVSVGSDCGEGDRPAVGSELSSACLGEDDCSATMVSLDFSDDRVGPGPQPLSNRTMQAD